MRFANALCIFYDKKELGSPTDLRILNPVKPLMGYYELHSHGRATNNIDNYPRIMAP